MNVSKNGRFKHIGYHIDGGTRGKHDSFTKCSNCGTRLWKDTMMDTVHCEHCGEVHDSNYEDRERDVSERKYPTLEAGKDGSTGFWNDQYAVYEHSGRKQMFGGYDHAYDDGEEYSFAELDDGIIDDVI